MALEPRKTAGMLNFERQLDTAFPNRKKPDGWIGDAAHRGHTSSHNPDDTPGSKPEWDGDPDNIPEVRAVDIFDVLESPVTMTDVVRHLAALPNLNTVIRYMIYDGIEYHERNGFKPTAYTGADPHLIHLHISFAFTQTADDNATFDYKFEELFMTTEEIAKAVWAYMLKNAYSGDMQQAGTILRYTPSRNEQDIIHGQITNLAETITSMQGDIAAIKAAILIPPKG